MFSINKNVVYFLAALVLIGGMFVLFKKTSILSLILPHSQFAWVDGSGLQYTTNSLGIQSLSYNGVDLISSAFGTFYDDKNDPATFVSADGTATTTVGPQRKLATLSTVCPDPNKTNPQCYQQIFNDGQYYSYTVTVELSTYDSNTLLTDVYVTNNDATNTLASFSMGNWLGTSMHLPDLAANFYGGFSTSPVAFILGSTWGSIALYTDDYTKNISVGTSNTYDTRSGVATNVDLLWNFNSYEHIAPGVTIHYPLYMKFGSTSDTDTSLAQAAYTAYDTAQPYLVNWTNRKPIARWIMADLVARSSTNPRGYFRTNASDETINALDQANFDALMATATDEVITNLNSMNPKPQAVLLWDIEGQEFWHYFSYVGYPNMLPLIAPEMDAVIDQVVTRLNDAGYPIALTLRPSSFQVGTVLPSTCHNDPSNADLNDVFIKTDAPVGYRGYECTATNTWTQNGYGQPSHQTCSWDDSVILNNLRTKINYARTRWNVKMFYVDSTVYCQYPGGGSSFNSSIFDQLETEYPDTLFMPENENKYFYRSTAPYNQVNMGSYNTPSDATSLYPQSFSVLANYDGVDFTNSTTRSTIQQSITAGNIFMVDAWWPNPTNEDVLQLYRNAGVTTAADVTAPTVTAFTVPSTSNSFTVGITTFTATDDVGVTKYLINESSAIPSANDAGWSNAATTTYRFSSNGNKTLYAWAKDAAGNISSSVSAPVTVTVVDTTAPVIGTFSIPSTASALSVSITAFTATDDTAVTGFLLSESATTPLASDSGWVSSAPTTYTFGSSGTKTLYAWTKDAAGNISAAATGSVTITISSGGGGGGGTTSGSSGGGGGGGATYYSLTLKTAGTGYGTTTSNPSGIICVSTTCTASFVVGSLVTLTAQPAASSHLTSWTGCTSVNGLTCTVTMSAAASVTATYDGGAATNNAVQNISPITSPIIGLIPSAYLNLPYGSRSTAVLTLQKYLITGGYLSSIYATGYYGQLTANAVAQYRLSHGGGSATSVSASGTITSYLFLSTTGAQVKTLQKMLNAKGYTIASSGIGSPGNETTYFGPATQVALQKFQCATISVCSGTPLTTGYGATGPRTRAALSGTAIPAAQQSVPISTYTPVKTTTTAPKTTTTTTVAKPIVVPVINFGF
jgi:hypothetical protein